jgi:hypothetical protein
VFTEYRRNPPPEVGQLISARRHRLVSVFRSDEGKRQSAERSLAGIDQVPVGAADFDSRRGVTGWVDDDVEHPAPDRGRALAVLRKCAITSLLNGPVIHERTQIRDGPARYVCCR